ncbi:CAMK family protein kinase [Tritrichomonas foetus]|uniref:CAMK family protein kinase n=1 Tax=Tritrichomonas foetus TaxID=1144522 RepID=A0A1J4J5P5_9EUKA|nr:CAMK family protein kinase [Tritrichomonas foetus]|eukprot:OHS94558.1 CAMK family protein kinase [Tritrichomonas foetus]
MKVYIFKISINVFKSSIVINLVMTRRYKFLEEIGIGSFATVVKALDLQTDTYVAIKIIDIHKDLDLQYIQKETEILASLNHSAIVKFYEMFQESNRIYIVMEFIDGCDLLNYINSKQFINEYDSRKLFCQMVCGLNYIHSHNIMHRDIKAENFMVTKGGKVKFIDFGLAQNSVSSIFNTQCGSLSYIAPEILLSQQYSYSADIWSLGIILYAITNKKLPFDELNDSLLRDKILYEQPKFTSKIPVNLEDLLKKLLNKCPKNRITIEEITKHIWLKNEFKMISNMLDTTPPHTEASQSCGKLPVRSMLAAKCLTKSEYHFDSSPKSILSDNIKLQQKNIMYPLQARLCIPLNCKLNILANCTHKSKLMK